MSEGRIEYDRGGWRKYSSKIFPRYEKQSWIVWEDEIHGTVFFDFELANIYAILLDLKLGEFNKK